MKCSLGNLILPGALLLAAADNAHAQGSIVYHDPQDVTIFGFGLDGQRHEMDLNTDGTVDFVFHAFTSFRIYSTTGARSIAVPAGGLNLNSWSIPLLNDFPIGSDLTEPLQWLSSFQPDFPPNSWIGQSLHHRNTAGSAGYWNPPVGELLTAYVGTEFRIGEAVHYGWIRVTVSGVGNGGIIHDWAYNAIPGQPILAGQVPEPGTWALLATGGGLLWWRCRRPRQTA